MIAEEKYRRQGHARRAIILAMLYAITKLGITRFIAKILSDNGM